MSEDRAAKARRILGARNSVTQVSDGVPERVSRRAPVVRTRKVRLNVDISPADHAALRRLCLDLTDAVGRQVTGADIVRELLAQVRDPEQLARLRQALIDSTE